MKMLKMGLHGKRKAEIIKWKKGYIAFIIHKDECVLGASPFEEQSRAVVEVCAKLISLSLYHSISVSR